MAMTLTDIQRELGRMKKLESALLQQASSATSADKIKALEAAQPHIKPKTKAMEALLQAGYHISLAEARAIIKERKADPQSWPFTEFKKAQAFLAAYEAQPTVISERAGWKRTRGG